MRTHRPTGADHGFEVRENRSGQRAAGVVDDRDGLNRNPVGQELQYLVRRADVPGDANRVRRICRYIVTGTTQFPPILIRRRRLRFRMPE